MLDLLQRTARSSVAFVRYAVVGVASLSAYVGMSAVLHRFFSMDAALANSAGYLIATGLNYLANFYWSFQTERPHREAIWRFLAVVAIGFSLNTLYVGCMLRLTELPVELISASFALAWPFVSFAALRLWALR